MCPYAPSIYCYDTTVNPPTLYVLLITDGAIL